MKSIECIECGVDNLTADLNFECGSCGADNGAPTYAELLERISDLESERDNAIRRGDELFDQNCKLHDALNDRDNKLEELEPYIKLKRSIDKFGETSK